MNNRRKLKKSVIVIIVLAVVLIISGISYALWQITHKGEETNRIESGCFEMQFRELTDSVNLTNSYPMSDAKGLASEPYTFTIKNKCEIYGEYVITLDVVNATTTIDESKIKVALDGAKNLSPTILGTLDENVTEETEIKTSYILAKDKAKVGGEEKTYSFRMWVDESAGNEVMGQGIEARLTITSVAIEDPNDPNRVLAKEFLNGSGITKPDVEYIEFVDHVDVPVEATNSWDASETKTGKVKAWRTPGSTGKHKVYIGAKGGVIAPEDSSFMFSNTTSAHTLGFLNLKTIEFNDNFNTSYVTDMNNMFRYAEKLISLNLSNFDTSNVTNMDSMFWPLTSLTSLDLSNFDTNNVTNMTQMFANTSSLTSLDLSNFDTSNVTNMNSMFYNITSLTSLDLGNFDTSNVTDMAGMFMQASNLTNLNLSNFDTRNVTNMTQMFYKTSSLTSLNLSSFNTSKVTSMQNMFASATSLTSMDLSNFDTSNVTNMAGMFSDSTGLTSLNLSSFDTSKVTDMRWVFLRNTNLTNLDISLFTFKAGVTYTAMFESTKANAAIKVKDLATKNYILTNIRSNLTGIYY